MNELKPCPFCGETPDEPSPLSMVYHRPSSCMLGNTSWHVDDWNIRSLRQPVETVWEEKPLNGVSCEHLGNGSARWSMSNTKENELRELLFRTQPQAYISRKTAMNWYYAGWELGCDKGESINAKIAFDEVWDKLEPANSLQSQAPVNPPSRTKAQYLEMMLTWISNETGEGYSQEQFDDAELYAYHLEELDKRSGRQPKAPVVEVSINPEPSAGLLSKWAYDLEYSDLDEEAEAFAKNFKTIPDAASRGFYVGWKLALLQSKGVK